MSRIRSMKPVQNEHGDLVRPITTQSKRGVTIKQYYHFYTGPGTSGHVEYIPMESAPRATVIRKPLFEVVDYDTGETFQLTKRQAKKQYSGRQVRKALKRLTREHKEQLRRFEQADLEGRRYENSPTSVEEAFEDFEMPEAANAPIDYDLEDPESLSPEGKKSIALDIPDAHLGASPDTENPEDSEPSEGEGFEVIETKDSSE